MAGTEKPKVMSKDATKKMGEMMPSNKTEEMSGGAEKNEALQAKARRMVAKKLGAATKHVFRDVSSDILPDFLTWPTNIVNRLRKAGRDYLKGLFADPNFPGCKYLPKIPMYGTGIYKDKGESLRLMAGNLRDSGGDIDKVKFPILYTRKNGKKVVIVDK